MAEASSSGKHTAGPFTDMMDRRQRRIEALASGLSASMAAAIVGARDDALTTRLEAGVSGGTVRALRSRGLLNSSTKALTPLGLEVRAVIAKARVRHERAALSTALGEDR